MQKSFRLVFWAMFVGLILFILAFGIPGASRIAAGQVLAAAGCTPPGFDMQAVCPPGSVATRFVPLGHWFTSWLAPYLLIRNFWDVLLAWVGIILAAAVASGLGRARVKPNAR
jgi:hypothetical protein